MEIAVYLEAIRGSLLFDIQLGQTKSFWVHTRTN